MVIAAYPFFCFQDSAGCDDLMIQTTVCMLPEKSPEKVQLIAYWIHESSFKDSKRKFEIYAYM